VRTAGFDPSQKIDNHEVAKNSNNNKNVKAITHLCIYIYIYIYIYVGVETWEGGLEGGREGGEGERNKHTQEGMGEGGRWQEG
jgi:hypothetical protein